MACSIPAGEVPGYVLHRRPRAPRANFAAHGPITKTNRVVPTVESEIIAPIPSLWVATVIVTGRVSIGPD
jgi:hypothetical protein